ncbi:hypothetical protein AGOR_G00064430 [Albula goreensis]|uniref:Immunoglobulin V-set domain-containing protein n=1 Tax=Albula goreensis TaxID=1534307 RepID=A0A8T3DUQ3_9TELE|nr:hypothetical protein AGOR_G00064430 [Albula goreensis]
MGAHRSNYTMWTTLTILASVLFLNEEPYLAWQIGTDMVVDHYIPGYTEDQHPQFKGRTRLFLREDAGNCSLWLSKVTLDDAKTYTCHYKDPVYTSSNITLRLRGEEEKFIQPTVKAPSTSSSTHWYAVGGVIFVIAVLSTVALTVRYKRRSTATFGDPQVAGQVDPLNPEWV